jgi:HSP20 family protein
MLLERMLPTDFDALQRQVERLFDGFETPPPTLQAYPALNVWDAGDAYMTEAELPGVRPEDLEVTALGDELTIKGQRRSAAEGGTLYRQERGAGEFVRRMVLPGEIAADKIEATLHDGVLTIKLPKAAKTLPRRIAVKPGA